MWRDQSDEGERMRRMKTRGGRAGHGRPAILNERPSAPMHPAAAPIRHPSGAIVADLVQALDQRGDVAKAADIGIEREAIFQIGRRLKPEVIGFAQAVQELGMHSPSRATSSLKVNSARRKGTSSKTF